MHKGLVTIGSKPGTVRIICTQGRKKSWFEMPYEEAFKLSRGIAQVGQKVKKQTTDSKIAEALRQMHQAPSKGKGKKKAIASEETIAL